MAKIQKQQITVRALSDWDLSPWDKETYQKHESDLQKIFTEYKDIKQIRGDDPRMIRCWWLESKGAMSIKKNNEGILEPQIIEGKYQTFSNMFERFSDWLSFKEKKDNTPEQLQSKIDNLTKDIKIFLGRNNFEIPRKIMEGAERDVEYEQSKNE